MRFIRFIIIVTGVFLSQMVFAKDSIVIAHRGASGYLPEHTLESKTLAYAQGANYLEQDLVMTKDDHLIVLHDLYLDRITNVDEIYPNRMREDGHFYAIDFTLDEIRDLRFTEGWKIENGKKIQVFPNRFPMNTSIFRIHTFEEELEFIQGLNKTLKKNIGIYPEIKEPGFHRKEGKDISVAVLNTLKKYHYVDKNSLIFLQTFDFDELKRIKDELFPKYQINVKLIQLIDSDFNIELLPEVAKFADGIGPNYRLLFAKDFSLKNPTLSPFWENARKLKLQIHPYTLRKDQLPDFAKNIDELHEAIFNFAKVDGVFSDFPDLTVNYLQRQK